MSKKLIELLIQLQKGQQQLYNALISEGMRIDNYPELTDALAASNQALDALSDELQQGVVAINLRNT